MSVPENVRTLLAPPRSRTVVALVGASTHPSKFGNIILRDLLRKGFTVRPVNPTEPAIEGLATHPRLEDVPDPVHIVNFVVPPTVALRLLPGLDPARFPVLWFQPGAFDGAVVAAARARFPTVLAGECIMVEAR